MKTIVQSLKTRPALWAALLILVPFAVRTWFAATGQLNLVQDEAQYWDWTRHLQMSYYSKGPLIALIIKFWTTIFGNTELGVRFGSILGFACTQTILFLFLSRSWRRPDLGLWTLFITDTMVLFMALGLLMTTDNSLIFCWASSMACLYLGSTPKKNLPPPSTKARIWPFAVLALLFGLGILAKYMMLAFGGLAFLYGFALRRRDLTPRHFWKYLFTALGAGLVIGFLPILIWNVQNGFVGFKHVSHLAGVGGSDAPLIRFDRFPDYIGSQFGLATPWWLLLMLYGGIKAVGAYCRNTIVSPFRERPEVDQRQSLLLATFFWPIWLFFIAWSFHTKIMPNWSAVSYVAGAMLAAHGLDSLLRARRIKSWGIYFLAALSLAIFLLVHTAHLLPIPREYNITNRLKGWEELGQTVEDLRLTRFANPDKVFIFSELYDMTSALAFYVPGQPRTYCAWVQNRRMNQYDIWNGPQDKIGWDAIFVRKKLEKGTYPDIEKMFESISDPIPVHTTYNGMPARTFTIFLCRGYNGYWPRKGGSF
ncbi:ArnT family glycosyltransferase [Salidesulfovibrio onnuriiensis]|uniref:ArnT family glycosyltransferase n=1 Tax=Salidesulfovibrio onnuriiensis TaxID=2583823 RepID=UPI0011CB07D2|nr:glycosyltransferase family 39 protein [Salidesulfovibrio onnuriiensis]